MEEGPTFKVVSRKNLKLKQTNKQKKKINIHSALQWNNSFSLVFHFCYFCVGPSSWFAGAGVSRTDLTLRNIWERCAEVFQRRLKFCCLHVMGLSEAAEKLGRQQSVNESLNHWVAPQINPNETSCQMEMGTNGWNHPGCDGVSCCFWSRGFDCQGCVGFTCSRNGPPEALANPQVIPISGMPVRTRPRTRS